MIVNNETLSHNEELVQDMISILDVFSCRLYGLRKYKNQIKERYLKSMVQKWNRCIKSLKVEEKKV